MTSLLSFVPLATAYRTLKQETVGFSPVSSSVKLTENWHTGWFVVTHLHQGIVYSTPGALEVSTFFRSSAKPFQAFPLLEANLDHVLSLEELAITCASHTGSEKHLTLVQSILSKAGLAESDLKCGAHSPIDEKEKCRLSNLGLQPSLTHNNCSGKHAGMLLYCQRQGLSLQDYLAPNHPLQKRLIALLQEWTGLPTIPTAIDGCGAPVFYLPLPKMAYLYALLGTERRFAPLQKAMTLYPELIGGQGRIDSLLMQLSKGQLLAKVGADGVMCVSLVGTGYGLALKIADGNEIVRNITVVEVLRRLGWLAESAWQSDLLNPYRLNHRLNTLNEEIGGYEVHFPDADFLGKYAWNRP